MRTGEVAAAAGVHIETLRYYERRGLLRSPGRTAAGYRRYMPEAVVLVRFIKRGQELGFTLAEIEELLRLRDARVGRCADVLRAAHGKRADIRGRIASLRAIERALDQLIASCSGSRQRICPLLETLEAPAPTRRRFRAALERAIHPKETPCEPKRSGCRSR